MPNDLYNYLIGGAPNDQQSQAALAAQLRRRRSFGELGALTGDRVLQSFGQGLSKSSDQYATDLQNIRQKDIDNAQTQAYQTGQLAHMKNIEDLTRRGQNLDHIYQMLMAQAALEKADKAGQGKPSKLTYADRTKLENMASTINAANDAMTGFKDEYSQRLGPGPQSRLPNTMAAMGIGTEGSKEAANWWSSWNLLYTLPQRNATFGATLTPTEHQAWRESDINPSMDAKTIRDRVSKIMKIVQSKGALMNKTYKAQYDPELIDMYELPGEEDLIPRSGGHGAVRSGQQIRVKVDENGNPLGN